MIACAFGPGGGTTMRGYAAAGDFAGAVLVAMIFSLLHDRAALLAHELRDVVGAAAALARGARALPAAEGLHAGPGARRRARGPVRVADPGLDLIEELLDLFLLRR